MKTTKREDYTSFKIEKEVKDKFIEKCDGRHLKHTDVMRFLVLHFMKNPDMKFDI